MKEVEALSSGRVRLSTGTLYGAIKRLLGDRWIRRAARPDSRSDRRERKFYVLTGRGKRALEAETRRLQDLLSVARRRAASGGSRSAD